MKQITQADHDVLKDFAKQFGRTWKSVLRQMWMNGDYRAFNISYGDDVATLQRLRNTLGPAWLVRFRLSVAATAPTYTGPDCGRTAYQRTIERHQDYADYESSFDA